MITGVIITKNEAANIERCLLALDQVCEEIIVVDSFSTDETATICNRFPKVKFIQQQWLGYGLQKNIGNQHAAYKYILSIDADEVLSDALIDSIKKEKITGLNGAYYIQRSNFYYGRFLKYGNDANDKAIRLFSKDDAAWNSNHVHEQLEFNSTIKTGILKGMLLHYTYTTLAQHVQKANSYSTLGAQLYYEKGKKTSLLKIIFSPLFTFIQFYILKLGFMDGTHGFIVNTMAAYSKFLKYSKLWLLQKKYSQ